jgi:hypothetical protein
MIPVVTDTSRPGKRGVVVTASVSDREGTADRLLHTSVLHSYDPVIDIDWAAPAVPGLFWLAPRRSSSTRLHCGTPWTGPSGWS